MSEETKGMKPIWYFVGLILILIGAVITITGFYNLYYPDQSGTVMIHLHPDIWWGAFMLVCGIIFMWTTRNMTIE